MLVRRNFGSGHHFWRKPAPQSSHAWVQAAICNRSCRRHPHRTPACIFAISRCIAKLMDLRTVVCHWSANSCECSCMRRHFQRECCSSCSHWHFRAASWKLPSRLDFSRGQGVQVATRSPSGRACFGSQGKPTLLRGHLHRYAASFVVAQTGCQLHR